LARLNEIVPPVLPVLTPSLHPNLLPGGYLWADMMLYDLKKAVGSWWRPRWWMMDE